MATPTVLDVIATAFGEPLGPDVIAAAGRMTNMDGSRLYDAAREWANGFTMPGKLASELRPFVPRRGSRFGMLGYPEEPFGAADLVKQHLLYCHSIALESPLLSLASNLNEFGRYGGRLVVAHFITLLELAPLIETGVVVYYPGYDPAIALREWNERSRTFRKALNSQLDTKPGGRLNGILIEVARSLDIRDYPPFAFASSGETPRPPDVDPGKFHLASEAYNYVSESIGAVVGSDGAVDMLMHYRHQDQVFRKLISMREISEGLHNGLTIQLLHDLLSMQLPSLAGLPTKDLVAIRRDEDKFETWRASLTTALGLLHSLGLDVLTNEQKLSTIAAGLQDSAAMLRSDVFARSWGRRARVATTEFSLGAIGIVGGSAIGGAIGAATAASIGGLALTQAVKLVVGCKPSQEASAQLSHYAIFNGSTNK